LQRPTQLIAPVDSVDYSRVMTAIEKSQVQSMAETRQRGFMMKNNQSEQLMEPTNVRPYQFVKNVDFLTHTVKSQS
jgi:hypothetical protein